MSEPSCDAIELTITPRVKDIGEMEVRRVLPYRKRRSVGPFVFFDEMGPAEFPPGESLAVRPHPHINLATVTYLFEGEILHRDSTGVTQAIRPGAINWMTAGRGIAHSERQGEAVRSGAATLHGLQLWIALPVADEETAPGFRHYPSEDLPRTLQGGADVRVMIGSAYGLTSPVETYSPMFYVDVHLAPGSSIRLPEGYTERAAYAVSGALHCQGVAYDPHQMLVFQPGVPATLAAPGGAHLVLLGGEPFPEPRHLWWNFVSSRRDRIEQAKADWRAGRFPAVVDDEDEFIPLPES